MLVIRRMVIRRGGGAPLFLPGEPPRVFPTTDHEYARIMQVFKQARRHRDIPNDFTDYKIAGGVDIRPLDELSENQQQPIYVDGQHLNGKELFRLD